MKNSLHHEKKIEGIKEALKYLKSNGVQGNFSKKMISETTRELFPDCKEKQVSQVTLSNDFYKDNLPIIIKEVFNFEPDYKLDNARNARNKIFQKKMKKIESFVKDLAIRIRSGETSVDKPLPSKSYLTAAIKDKYGYTINFSIEKYEWLYSEIFIQELLRKESADENIEINKKSFVSLEKYNKVLKEKKRIENELNNIIIGDFENYIDNGEKSRVFSSGDGIEELHNITIDKQKFEKFLGEKYLWLYNKQDTINAYKLIKLIIEECKE